MFRVTIKNLLARKFRLVLTSIAVMLGVAFMAGTFVLTDTMAAVFDDLFTDVNKGVDVAVRKARPRSTDTRWAGYAGDPRAVRRIAARAPSRGVDGRRGRARASVQGLALVVTLGRRPARRCDQPSGADARRFLGPERRVSEAFAATASPRSAAPNDAEPGRARRGDRGGRRDLEGRASSLRASPATCTRRTGAGRRSSSIHRRSSTSSLSSSSDRSAISPGRRSPRSTRRPRRSS